jgi:hypothetical protein
LGAWWTRGVHEIKPCGSSAGRHGRGDEPPARGMPRP